MVEHMKGYLGAYPTMVYNPENPQDYKICETVDEIPEGWVDNQSKCVGGANYGKQEATPKTKKAATPKTKKAATPKTKKAATPKTKKAATPKTKKEETKVTLESLDVSREEAIEILEEEEIKVEDDATDEAIAEALEPLLD